MDQNTHKYGEKGSTLFLILPIYVGGVSVVSECVELKRESSLWRLLWKRRIFIQPPYAPSTGRKRNSRCRSLKLGLWMQILH